MPRLAYFLLLVSALKVIDTDFYVHSFSPAASIASPRATKLSRERTWAAAVPAVPGRIYPRPSSALNSAAVLPAAYASASIALLYRAARATSRQDCAVALATAVLAAANLAPGDNARLSSAKAAYKRHPPASSGREKARRQAALTWRSAVRVKIVGQLVGLAWAVAAGGPGGRLRGGAAVMAANAAFFLVGGGRTVHNAAGENTPMPVGLVRSVLAVDAVLACAAWIAASSQLGSGRRAIAGGIYVAGVSMGALEGLAALVSN